VSLDVQPSDRPARLVVFMGEAPRCRLIGAYAASLAAQAGSSSRRGGAAAAAAASSWGAPLVCSAGGAVTDLEVRVLDAFDRPLHVKALALRNLQPEPGGGGKGPKGGLACVSLAQGRDQVFAQSWQEVLASAAEEEELGPPDVAINLPDLIQPKKFKDSARTVRHPAASLLFFGFV